MSKKLTTEEFIQRAKEIHGDRYDYSITNYKGRTQKVTIICKEHGIFECGAAHHLDNRAKSGKGGCYGCYLKRNRLTQKDFLDKAKAIHGDKYDYSKFIYINARTKGIIICPIHGEFEQNSFSHTQGKGCRKCAFKTIGEKASDKNTKPLKHFIEKAIEKHGDKYDYSLIDEKPLSHKKHPIICPEHGVFQQRLHDHVAGRGCRKCNAAGMVPKTFEERIEQFKAVHGDVYDYSLINKNYGAHDKIPIICRKHGLFHQNQNNHRNGSICPTCSDTASTSRGEKEWLDSIGLPNTPDHRQVVKKIGKSVYRFDGFDPQTNTVYEYHGDYWHGNLKIYNPDDKNAYNGITMQELFNRTTIRSQNIRNSGYNLVSIWESDWKILCVRKIKTNETSSNSHCHDVCNGHTKHCNSKVKKAKT